MSWKKTGFSYLMWAVYTLFAGWALVQMAVALSFSMGLGAYEGYGMAAGICLLAGLCVFLLHRVCAKPKQPSNGMSVSLVTEAVAVVVLLILGLLLRMDGMSGLGGQEDLPGAAYFEKARVAEGQSVPREAGCAEYLYLKLLHLLFVFLGNNMTPGLWLQVILQLLAGLLLYLGIRRFGGVLSGLIFLSFLMCGETGVKEALSLSPDALYLLLFAVGLLLCAGRKVQELKPGWFAAAGCAAGLALYLDVSGGLLLVFLGAAALSGDGEAKKRRLLAMGAGLLGTALMFIVSAGADALASGRALPGTLAAWAELYQPRIVSLEGGYYFSVMEGSLLTLLFVFGVFSFWCSKKWERMSVWVAAGCAAGLASGLGMLQEALSPVILFLTFLAALAGLGVEGSFRGELAPETAGEAPLGAAPSEGEKDASGEKKKASGKNAAGKGRAKSHEKPGARQHGKPAGKALAGEQQEIRLPKYLQGTAAIPFLKEETEPEPQQEEAVLEVEEAASESAMATVSGDEAQEEPEAAPVPGRGEETALEVEESASESAMATVSGDEAQEGPEAAPDAGTEPAPESRDSAPRYIENPLPLPKPHQKKVLDYDYPLEPGKEDYDLQVEDGDDFDLT